MIVLMVGLLGFTAIHPAAVSAQSDENAWEKPINLSQSGGTNNPIVVPGANGVLHALWQDRYAGLIYRRFNGKDWEPAIVGEFPFGVVQSDAQRVVLRISLLQLFSGKNGLIHAFWVDAEGHLLYSHVNGDDMAKAVAWTPPMTLAESAVGYDMSIDALGGLHLAYVRSLQSTTIPAGVYYKHSTDSGQNWSQPSFIYQSAYLRDLTPELTNVNIDSAGTGGDRRGCIFPGITARENRSSFRSQKMEVLPGEIHWKSTVQALIQVRSLLSTSR